MIRSFAIEIISINRRKKKKKTMSYTTSIGTEVMLTGELNESVNRSKPTSVDSQSSSDWFSREILGS